MLNPDGITTSPPTCIFCGSTKGPFDVEDVFPKWVRTVFPPTIEVQRGIGDGKVHRTNVLELKLQKAVCNPPRIGCNGGWMSVLENEAKGVLSDVMRPDIRHFPVRLDRAAQRVIAFWAAEKTLCIELALRQSVRGYKPGYIPAEHFKWLYDHRSTRTLPPGTKVWIFGYEAQPVGHTVASLSNHQSVIVTHQTNDTKTPVGNFSTITLGCLGLQVFGHDLIHSDTGPVEPEPLMLPVWLRPILIELGSNSLIIWGTKKVVTESTVKRLATWGPIFEPPP